MTTMSEPLRVLEQTALPLKAGQCITQSCGLAWYLQIKVRLAVL
jgi:hypothetical protein